MAVAKPWGITPCCESDETSVDVVGYDSIVSMKGGQSCMKKRNFKKKTQNEILTLKFLSLGEAVMVQAIRSWDLEG